MSMTRKQIISGFTAHNRLFILLKDMGAQKVTCNMLSTQSTYAQTQEKLTIKTDRNTFEIIKC